MGNHENKRKTDRSYADKPSRIQLKGKEYRLNDISDGGPTSIQVNACFIPH